MKTPFATTAVLAFALLSAALLASAPVEAAKLCNDGLTNAAGIGGWQNGKYHNPVLVCQRHLNEVGSTLYGSLYAGFINFTHHTKVSQNPDIPEVTCSANLCFNKIGSPPTKVLPPGKIVKQPVPSHLCPSGQHLTGGHCCPNGTSWFQPTQTCRYITSGRPHRRQN